MPRRPYRDRPPATPHVARAGDPRPPCACLIHSRVLEASCPRPVLLHLASRALELGRAEQRRRQPLRQPNIAAPASIRYAPTPSPHPTATPPHPVPDRAFSRPNRPCAAAAIRASHQSFALAVDDPLPALLRPNQTLGELTHAAPVLPDPFPSSFCAGATGTRSCRRQPARLSPLPLLAVLARPRATPLRASGSPARAGRSVALPHRHLPRGRLGCSATAVAAMGAAAPSPPPRACPCPDAARPSSAGPPWPWSGQASPPAGHRWQGSAAPPPCPAARRPWRAHARAEQSRGARLGWAFHCQVGPSCQPGLGFSVLNSLFRWRL